MIGGTWEGFCIKTLIATAPPGPEPFICRTAEGPGWTLRCALAGVLDLIGKAMDRVGVGLGDDLVQRALRLDLGRPGDGKGALAKVRITAGRD
ncbi:MAG: hypothetical protein Q4615_02905 [Paracoccus aminovorans]|nr:hypothetical protein [Paracoccus aminovorans]